MGRDKNEMRKYESFSTGFIRKKSNGHETKSFTWDAIGADRLWELIQLVTSRGGAIRFGYSRDGNAGSIGVYYGDNRDTLYIRPDGDPEESFRLIEVTFEEYPNSGGKSPDYKP